MTDGTAGLVKVSGDGTYSATPTLGPAFVPSLATSLAQAIFEEVFPVLLDPVAFPPATQAKVVDAVTTPPTTAKGRTMQNIAGQTNGYAAAIVGYLAPCMAVQVPSEGTVAAGLPEFAIYSWPTAVTIGSISLVPNMSAAASGSAFATITIARRQNGGAPTTIASFSTSTSALTAFVPASFGLSSPIQVAPGDVWTCTVAKSGAGVLLGGGCLQLRIQ